MPEVSPDHAVLQIHSTGICGSDLFIVTGKNPRTPPPLIPGHETVGHIVALPEGDNSGFQIGDRVVPFVPMYCGRCRQCRNGRFHQCEQLAILGCQTNGAFAEYISLPQSNLVPVPDDMTDAQAILVEPTSIAVHAVAVSNITVGENVVVVGAGPIGFLVAHVAREAGAARVILVDVADFRIDIARQAGFETLRGDDGALAQQILDATEGLGVDIVFECAAQNSSVGLFARTGTVDSRLVVVANFKHPTEIDLFQLMRKQQVIQLSFLASREDYDVAVSLLRRNRIPAALVGGTNVPFDQINRGFEIARSGKSMRVAIEIAGQ